MKGVAGTTTHRERLDAGWTHRPFGVVKSSRDAEDNQLSSLEPDVGDKPV